MQLTNQELDNLKVPTGIRAINWLIDSAIIMLIDFGVKRILNMETTLVLRTMHDIMVHQKEILQSFLVAVSITIVYYTSLESAEGATFGKLLTNTKVVDMNGNKPSFTTILLRSICRNIPFNVLSFIFTTTGRGWHDKLSNTKLVQRKKFSELLGR